jgi:hypothetical protein
MKEDALVAGEADAAGVDADAAGVAGADAALVDTDAAVVNTNAASAAGSAASHGTDDTARAPIRRRRAAVTSGSAKE